MGKLNHFNEDAVNVAREKYHQSNLNIASAAPGSTALPGMANNRHLRKTPFLRPTGFCTKLDFLTGTFHIILKLANLEIGEHSSYFRLKF